MKTYNTYYRDRDSLELFLKSEGLVDNTQLLVQIFTARTEKASIQELLKTVAQLLPTAVIIGSTTDGEICSGKVTTGESVISFTQFDDTRLKSVLLENCDGSHDLGSQLAKNLVGAETKLLICFADALSCNAEAFLEGIASVDSSVAVAGGLAGDNATFVATYVFSRDGVSSNGAVGVSLDNSDLYVHSNYSFNWLAIGRSMRITKAEGNRVYTIDDIPACKVYEKYLGTDVAKELPAIGVEFPLIVTRNGTKVARAVLHKDDDGSLTFGGLLRVNEEVTFGYGDAEMILNRSIEAQYDMLEKPVESIFIYSCMARRRFMPNLIEDEISPFQQLSDVAGFFTYGEFYSNADQCELLNQTMTIVGLSESKELQNSKVKKHTLVQINDYQKSIKALSHLLNTTIDELAEENREHEQRANMLAAKSESLHLAQEVGHFGSWEIDLVTGSAIWSDESYRIYKMDPDTAQPTLETFTSRVIEQDREKLSKAMKQAVEDGKIHSEVLRVIRDDGVEITILVNGKMIFDTHKKPIKLIGTTLDITEQVQLREHNEELAAIIEHSGTEIYIVEAQTYNYLYVNEAALKRLGYSREEMNDVSIFDVNQEMDIESVRTLEKELISSGSIFNYRTIHTCKDGSTYPVQSYLQYRRYDNRDVAIVFDVDIRELIASEQKQKQQSRILEQIHDSVVTTDLDGIVTHWNHGAEMIHGYRAEEMIGESVEKLYLSEDLEKLRWMQDQALQYGVHHDEIRKVNRLGEVLYTNITLSPLKDEEDNVIGMTRLSQDITQKKEIEERLLAQTQLLNYQAYHDALTNLPNRSLFNDRLEKSISTAQRNGGKFALLFIDLDNFKQINDTLGHHYGDEVLKVVARRLADSLREEDTLSRLGGDEFTVLVQSLKRASDVSTVAHKIIMALEPKIVIDRYDLRISASIGISLYPKDATNHHDLLKFADSAMYKAKEKGRNNFQFYSSDMTKLAFEKVEMERSMHDAMEAGDFVVYYQPQINAETNTIVGVEALVRWQHSKLGMITPDRFIPLAEERGFIIQLDSFVMLQAMRDHSSWRKSGLTPGQLSLNLSMKQLMSRSFLPALKEAIEETSFDVRWLEFEITESQMMLDPTKSIEILESLSKMGIEIAIDDFGTGYSSLAYLKRLPVNKLKIDRSFIKDLPQDDEDRAISKAIIALAKSLNLQLVAEGVEHEDQVRYLLENGCHNIQGYYYSRPVEKEMITEYLQNGLGHSINS